MRVFAHMRVWVMMHKLKSKFDDTAQVVRLGFDFLPTVKTQLDITLFSFSMFLIFAIIFLMLLIGRYVNETFLRAYTNTPLP
jgi:hypothetical protein